MNLGRGTAGQDKEERTTTTTKTKKSARKYITSGMQVKWGRKLWLCGVGEAWHGRQYSQSFFPSVYFRLISSVLLHHSFYIHRPPYWLNQLPIFYYELCGGKWLSVKIHKKMDGFFMDRQWGQNRTYLLGVWIVGWVEKMNIFSCVHTFGFLRR